jgi:hypothetical protein
MRSDIKIGVGSSVIASFIFIYFLDPIVTAFGRIIRIGTSQAYQSYLDGLFAQMAIGVEAKLPLVLLSLPAAVFIALAILVILRTLGSRMRRRKSAMQDGNDNAANTRTLKPVPPARHRLPFLRFTKALLTIALGFVVLANLWSYWYCLKITTSFRQHIAIVGPCLTDAERRQLEAAWASMQSERDYRVLYGRLKQVAQRCGRTLPPNRLFSPGSIL